MESPAWFPSFRTKKILDLEMSKCSIQIFMATLLIIKNLEPITQEEAPWSHRLRIVPSDHPQSTEVWLIRGHVLKIGGWQKLPALLSWHACVFTFPLPGSISLKGIRSIALHTAVLMRKISYGQHELNRNTINKEGSIGSARKAATRSKQDLLSGGDKFQYHMCKSSLELSPF